MGVLDPRVILFFMFKETVILFPIVAAPFDIPITGAHGSQLLHASSPRVPRFVDSSSPDGRGAPKFSVAE